MGRDEHRGGSKSPENQHLEVTRRVNEALSKSVDNEKRIIELEKVVQDRNQWNNLVRDWIGMPVKIELVNSSTVLGMLEIVDRYTLIINKGVFGSEKKVIVHKGAIATIELDT